MVLPLNHPFCFGCSKVTMGFIPSPRGSEATDSWRNGGFHPFQTGDGDGNPIFQPIGSPNLGYNEYLCMSIYMCVCVRVRLRVRVCVWGMKFRSNVSWEWVFQPLGSSFVFTSAFLRLSKQHFCSILDKETPCLRPKPWQKSACWPSVVVSGISGAWPVVVESLYYNGSINIFLI